MKYSAQGKSLTRVIRKEDSCTQAVQSFLEVYEVKLYKRFRKYLQSNVLNADFLVMSPLGEAENTRVFYGCTQSSEFIWFCFGVISFNNHDSSTRAEKNQKR